MSLFLGLYAGPDGPLLLDATPRVRTCVASSTARGYARLEAVLGIYDPQRQFALYDWTGHVHAQLMDDGIIVWQGRVEDMLISDGGVRVTAYGYQNALRDLPYTALWSSTIVQDWQPYASNIPSAAPDLYQFNTQDCLFVGLKKSTIYRNAGTDVGYIGSAIPHRSTRQIVRASYTIDVLLPTGFTAFLARRAEDYSGGTVVVSWAGNGGLQTFTRDDAMSACDRIDFGVFNSSAGNITFAGEDGTNYIRVLGLRVATQTPPVEADDIAADLVAQVRAVNPSMLSSLTRLQATGLDLFDETYTEASMADVLDRLALLGDIQRRSWDWSVWDRVLSLGPRGSGRAWHIDATEIEIERSLATLANSAYATYQQSGGRIQRTTTTDDTASQARYGVTRRRSVAAQTAYQALAEQVRDTALTDGAQPKPRISFTVRRVFDQAGQAWPLSHVRGGDTVTLRALSPALSSTIDRIRTFRIAEADYDAVKNELLLTPESPLATLDAVIAYQQASIGSSAGDTLGRPGVGGGIERAPWTRM